jgi:CHASE3 domain sensor protein
VHAVTDLTGDKDNEVRQLLREIRDAQREQLAEYRRVTERSLELQQRAVARQEQFSRFYRRITAVTGVVIVFVLVLLAFTLTKWWRYLFGF